jgi:pentafunctional AROM polypeptide
MHKVSILGHETIFVGSKLTDTISTTILQQIPKSAYIFITDQNVERLHHLNHLLLEFKQKSAELGMNSKIYQYVIPPGEVYKTRKTKELIEDYLLERACTRDSCMIALGGGVIGDLAGMFNLVLEMECRKIYQQ